MCLSFLKTMVALLSLSFGLERRAASPAGGAPAEGAPMEGVQQVADDIDGTPVGRTAGAPAESAAAAAPAPAASAPSPHLLQAAIELCTAVATMEAGCARILLARRRAL